MTAPFRLVGITGSLRKGSWNTKLLNAFGTAARDPEFAQRGVQFEIADWSKFFLLAKKSAVLTKTDYQYTMGIWNLMFLRQCWNSKRLSLRLMGLSFVLPNTITRAVL
jgi:hypothetical protein